MQHQKTITITGLIKRWMSKKLKTKKPQQTNPVRLEKLERPRPKKKPTIHYKKMEILLILFVIIILIIIPILIYATGGCLESTNYYNHGLI